MAKRSTDNEILGAILSAHGCTVAEYKGWVVVDNKMPALNAETHSLENHGDAFMVQLDTRAYFDPECVIIESFAGVGATEGDARKNAFENFISNSFHVFTGAFFNPDDDQVTHETWQFNEQEWRATIGTYGLRTPDGAAVELPKNLFETFKGLIQTLPLSGDRHWFRLYYMRLPEGEGTCEVLRDNQPWEDAVPVMTQLPWSDTENYYSVRLFLILQKVPTITTT